MLVIPGHLACKCPIYRDGVVGVRVSNNGDAYSNTAVLFEVQRPLLHSVFPLCGPQLGSTTVVITGVGMPKRLLSASLTTAVLLLQPCTRQGTFHV